MNLVPPHIAAIKPYVPGKPMAELERELGLTSTIKLASNENPVGPSPKVLRALRASLRELEALQKEYGIRRVEDGVVLLQRGQTHDPEALRRWQSLRNTLPPEG